MTRARFGPPQGVGHSSVMAFGQPGCGARARSSALVLALLVSVSAVRRGGGANRAQGLVKSSSRTSRGVPSPVRTVRSPIWISRSGSMTRAARTPASRGSRRGAGPGARHAGPARPERPRVGQRGSHPVNHSALVGESEADGPAEAAARRPRGRVAQRDALERLPCDVVVAQEPAPDSRGTRVSLLVNRGDRRRRVLDA